MKKSRVFSLNKPILRAKIGIRTPAQRKLRKLEDSDNPGCKYFDEKCRLLVTFSWLDVAFVFLLKKAVNDKILIGQVAQVPGCHRQKNLRYQQKIPKLQSLKSR